MTDLTPVDNPPSLHDEGASDDAQAERRVLLHEEHGHAEGSHVAQRPPDLGHHRGRQPGRRLVDEQELRVRHQGAGHGERGLLPPGHRPGLLVVSVGEDRELREHAVDELPVAGLVPPAQQVAAETQVLLHRQAGEDLAALGNMAHAERNPLLGGEACHIGTGEAHRAGPDGHGPGDDLHRDALARAVEAEQPDDLAFGHGQVHAVKDRVGAEPGAHAGKLEQRRPAVRRRRAHATPPR